MPDITAEICAEAPRVAGRQFVEGMSSKDLAADLREASLKYELYCGLLDSKTTAQMRTDLKSLSSAAARVAKILGEAEKLKIKEDILIGLAHEAGLCGGTILGIETTHFRAAVGETGEMRTHSMFDSARAFAHILEAAEVLEAVAEIREKAWKDLHAFRDLDGPYKAEYWLCGSVLPSLYEKQFGEKFSASKTASYPSPASDSDYPDMPQSGKTRFVMWAAEIITGAMPSQDTVYRAWRAVGGTTEK
jgi:hypothetical protein